MGGAFMYEGPDFFDVIRVILLFLSPVVFLEGALLLLLNVDKYTKLEKALSKEVGGMKKRVAPTLESNIYAFHNWLTRKSIAFGGFCIIYSLLILFLFRK
jgi:hypothetical protein